jgi:hypothetical protein
MNNRVAQPVAGTPQRVLMFQQNVGILNIKSNVTEPRDPPPHSVSHATQL